MSELEIITLTLSLVLGLSVAQMLSSIALSIRSRHESRLHWLPLSWTAAIFLFHVQFLFAVFDLDSIVPSWTWDWYGPILLMSVLLFLSGALILPARDRDLALGLLEDFRVHGRLALIPISIYLILWIPMNVRMGFDWVSVGNGLDVILVILAAVTFLGRASRVGAVASVAYFLVEAWGVFVIWSRPGVEG